MKKIAIFLVSIFIITSCGKTNENPQNIEDNNSSNNTENNSSVETNNDSKNNDLEDELMNNEDFKMHFSSNNNGEQIEAIMQKQGKNMSMEIIKMSMSGMSENFKMKQMILKDNFYYTNMEIGGKDIWTKGEYNQEKQEEAGFIDVKKLLKKIKEENAKKQSKEIEGTKYDCYSGEFLNGSEMCFEGEKLKYILDKEGYKMKIIEYTDKIDKKAFKVPNDNEIISKQDLTKIMMENMSTGE